jgi:hypothetical protein
MSNDTAFDLSHLPQAVQESLLQCMKTLVHAWPAAAVPPPAPQAFVAAEEDPRGEMRRHIVALLQQHPEGLAPVQVQQRLGVDKDLDTTLRRMRRDGLARRLALGLYVAGSKERYHD